MISGIAANFPWVGKKFSREGRRLKSGKVFSRMFSSFPYYIYNIDFQKFLQILQNSMKINTACGTDRRRRQKIFKNCQFFYSRTARNSKNFQLFSL